MPKAYHKNLYPIQVLDSADLETSQIHIIIIWHGKLSSYMTCILRKRSLFCRSLGFQVSRFKFQKPRNCQKWVPVEMSPPEQAAELLLWYMQWSRDLAAEMHQRR